jgi:[ribosomal protein S5]-alanine N-acetyltransferase
MTPDALPEVIATARLELRPWSLDDVDDVYSYARDPEWSRYLHLVPVPYSRHDAELFLARQILLDRPTHASWAITFDGVAIGGINLRFLFGHRLAELGYSVARAHWNRGFCSEAARAVVDAAFERHSDLNRVRAFADARNTASQRVMEKLGMVREGVLRANRIERGEVMDEAWYGLLRSEWEHGREAVARPAEPAG